MSNDELIEFLGELRDSFDNVRAAGNIPMPDSLRVLALTEWLESKQERIQEVLDKVGG